MSNLTQIGLIEKASCKVEKIIAVRDFSEVRKDEIRRLLLLSPEEVKKLAGKRLFVCTDIDELHKKMADDIATEIQTNNNLGQPTKLILPVGPVGQYPYLAEKINTQNISLDDCWFFFMDEYCDEDGRAVDANHPLSFKGCAYKEFFNRLDRSCRLNSEHVFFPDERNIDLLEEIIEGAGGIDTCYGGIGIHGHVAFNEPIKKIASTGPRKVRLNDFTVTLNAVRSEVGGNLECFPRYAFTLGMKQILSAKTIRLYCRNGCNLDWANTILRIALFAVPGDDYPVTHLRNCNYFITSDQDTLSSPKWII
jgi:glucosamine-6-phosphate deaminase